MSNSIRLCIISAMSQQATKSEKKNDAPKGPETDPNVLGRPSSIIWIYLVFGLVIVIAAGLGGGQSSTMLVRLKELWARLVGR